MEERKRNANTRKISSKLQKRKHSGSFFQVSGSCVWPAGAYRHRPDHWCGYHRKWPSLHYRTVFYPCPDGCCRTYSQHHSPVFCCKGQRWICHRTPSGCLWPCAETFLHGTRHPRNRHSNHPPYRRYQPGTEWCKYGTSSSSSKPVYRTRLHGHGIHHQLPLCPGLRRCDPIPVSGHFCDHVSQYPAFPQGTEPSGYRHKTDQRKPHRCTRYPCILPRKRIRTGIWREQRTAH